jgi:hypothetical protein
MTEGAWITLAATILSVGGVVIAGIIKLPIKHSGSGASIPDPQRCPAHSGLVADIRSLHESQKRIEVNQKEIWTAVDETRTDIKLLIKSNGAPP